MARSSVVKKFISINVLVILLESPLILAEEEGGKSTFEWVLQMSAIVGLVMLSGLFSGLTLGLMSLDKIGLEIVIGAGEAENATSFEKKQAFWAKKISPGKNVVVLRFYDFS